MFRSFQIRNTNCAARSVMILAGVIGLAVLGGAVIIALVAIAWRVSAMRREGQTSKTQPSETSPPPSPPLYSPLSPRLLRGHRTYRVHHQHLVPAPERDPAQHDPSYVLDMSGLVPHCNPVVGKEQEAAILLQVSAIFDRSKIDVDDDALFEAAVNFTIGACSMCNVFRDRIDSGRVSIQQAKTVVGGLCSIAATSVGYQLVPNDLAFLESTS